MDNVTRRRFIQGTAAIAAGAAAGLMAHKGFREYGPVDMRIYLLSMAPDIIKSLLFSDERRDIFGIRVLDEHGDAVRAEMPLSRIREILVSVPSRGTCPVTIHYRGGRTERESVVVAAKSEKFTMRVHSDLTPVWLWLSDVQRVLCPIL